MSDPKYNFQYCQKIILFTDDWSKVLLAKRKGEADYDGVFSLIGGKMETADADQLAGLRREKNEEIGASARISVYLEATHNVFFRKQDGNAMILPHYVGLFHGGEIQLNDEYSEYQWVDVGTLRAFEPKIETIPEVVGWALSLHQYVSETAFVEL